MLWGREKDVLDKGGRNNSNTKKKRNTEGTSPVAQWLRLCLPTQGVPI